MLLSQVVSFLAEQDLSQYAADFESNGISGADLMDLTHEDLASMGVDRCTDRKRVLRAVRTLLQGESPVASAEPSTSAVREINGVREDASVHFCMLPKPRVGSGTVEWGGNAHVADIDVADACLHCLV